MTKTKTIFEWVKLNWKNLGLILAIAIIFLTWTCKGSEPSIAQSHKEKAKTYSKAAQNEVKGTDVIISNYKDTVAFLIEKNKTLAKLLAKSENRTNDKLSDLKQYKNSSIVSYYQGRYSITDGLKSIDTNTIAVKDNVSRLVIGDLIKYDGLKYDTPILKSMLVTSNQKYEFANKTIDTLKLSIGSISKKYELSNSEKDKTISSLENIKYVKWRILGGAGFGLNSELNQTVKKVNLGFQYGKGNIVRGSYQKIGSQEYYMAEYDFCIWGIKGK
jgi:hypothetical protein